MNPDKYLKMIQNSPQNTVRKEIFLFLKNQGEEIDENKGYFKNLLYQSHLQKMFKDKNQRKYQQQSWTSEQKYNSSYHKYEQKSKSLEKEQYDKKILSQVIVNDIDQYRSSSNINFANQDLSIEDQKSNQKQTKDSYETQEDLSFEKQNENLLLKTKPFKIIQRKKSQVKIEPKIIQKVKVEGNINEDIPIKIIRCFQQQKQIYFEIEWKKRISGLQPESSYINFDEFQKYEAYHLIDFLTSQIFYVDYNGTEKQIHISKGKKDYLTINQQNFVPEKILKIFQTNHGPTFEIEWKKLHNTKPEPSLVFYRSLKEAFPNFLLDFYKQKIILD